MNLDGCTPARIRRPESTAELSDILKEEKGAVVPVGAATQLEHGNPLRRADCAIDLTGLNRITEYNPADLTIHVQGGVTLGQLRAALAENHQFLPLDPWNGERATLGGIAAAQAQGPYRAMGAFRDWIIGMSVVEVDGRASKTGGRVVKNVTGYDLAKLYTGSLGSLAIIVEISLKLRAAFSRTATATTRCDSTAAAANLLGRLRQSPLQPVAAEWIGPENLVWLRFGEHPRAVDWQLNELKDLPAPGGWNIVEGREEEQLWETLRLRFLKMGPGVLKVLSVPSQLPDVMSRYRPPAWIAHAVNGITFMEIGDAGQVAAVRKSYPAVIERAPLEWRRAVPVFGLRGTEAALMRKMKAEFDPEGRLNPGRHVDGEAQDKSC